MTTMKKFKQPLFMIAAFIMLLSSAMAQDAIWKLDFEKGVEWTRITESGILLVGSSDRTLYGIDSRDGNILWTNDILKGSNPVKGPDGKRLEDAVAFDRFIRFLEDPEYPEMNDFIEVKFTDNIMVKNYSIINIQTGEVVISPEKANMPITKLLGKQIITFNYNGSNYIPELRMAIISSSYQDFANHKGSVASAPWVHITKAIKFPEAKVIWETKDIGIDVYPFVLNNGDLILPGKNIIMRMDSKTGAMKWKVETSEKNQNFESFDLSVDLSTGYFFEKKKNNGSLVAHDMNTGKRLWEVEMSLKEVPALSAMGYGVVTIDSKEFVLYGLKDGKELWKKKKIDGTVVDLGDMGILVTVKGKYLTLLNKNTGEVIWDEKITGVGIDQVIAKGILYTDAKGRLGLIQYDGQKVWDKKGMLEVPSIRYRPDFDIELMYIDGDLYEVNLFTGEYRVLVAKLDKSWKDDGGPTGIELVANGYLISSSNEFRMLESDGKVRWEKFLAPPEMSLAAKIALRAGQVAAFAMMAAASAESSANRSPYGGETYYSKMYAQQAQAWAQVGAGMGAEAKKKFKATVSRGNDVLVLTKVGEGGQAKSSGLVKVDKKTGDELGSLLLGDKKPTYDYDAITSTVFFKADKKQIICYKI